jgi:hypothetical protein
MTLSRLITWMTGIQERAVEALPPIERAQLAAQCRHLLAAAEPLPKEPETPRPAFRSSAGEHSR